MENPQVKIRINLSQAEIEVEGSEEFVEKHIDKMEKYFRLIKINIPSVLSVASETATNVSDSHEKAISPRADLLNNVTEIPTQFGEWIHKFPTSASDAQKVLFAGYYCQKQSENNSFNSILVNKLLIDHGIKLSNTSARIKDLLDSKKIFLVEGKGRKSTFRIAREAELSIIHTLTE